MTPLAHVSHYALRVEDVERSINFYLNVEGIDITERCSDGSAYIRRGADHHCLALYPMDSKQSHDPETSGRPAPGLNLFIDYPAPDGNVIELFAAMDQIHNFDNCKPLQWNPRDAGCVWPHITQ